MRFFLALKTGVPILVICLCVQAQTPPATDAQTAARGLPPRAAPSDYQAHAQAGAVTIAAEFTGHSVPTLQGSLSTEDYIVIETALFGSSGARLQLSAGDFSLRINAKKTPLPAQQFGLILESLKDPEWEPPEAAEKKSKTRFGSGGGAQHGQSDGPPAPVKIPIAVQRAMAQRVQQAALPEGDRALPQAGLIFFQYRGKTQGIRSIELLYAGPAGTATLTLQP